MESNNKISISGDLGSGKTTVSHLIAERLGFERFSTGDIQRKLAAENNMTTLEFNKLSDTKESIDKLIDGKTIEIAKTDKNIVFDSRMAWYFVPDSFSVRLIINDVIGAERIMNAQRGSIEEYKNIEDALNKVSERKNSEKNRFKKKYGVNLLDFHNYDLVIDTSYVTPEEVLELLISQYNLWKKRETYKKIWINPKNLYPAQSIRSMDEDKIRIIESRLTKEHIKEIQSIQVIRFQEKNYIFNGHHTVGASLLKNVKFLPIKLVEEGNPLLSIGETIENYIVNSTSRSMFYDWEDAFGFHFKSYPRF